MAVALASMVPVARLARRVGLKPVVALGFAVYAVFPALLVTAPADAGVLALLFAVSGLRFAGLPAHKALVVGPAERDAGGRVTGSYYLVRNVVVTPSAALGGVIYGGLALPGVGQVIAGSPTLAFGAATVIGLLGTGYFLVRGEEFGLRERQRVTTRSAHDGPARNSRPRSRYRYISIGTDDRYHRSIPDCSRVTSTVRTGTLASVVTKMIVVRYSEAAGSVVDADTERSSL